MWYSIEIFVKFLTARRKGSIIHISGINKKLKWDKVKSRLLKERISHRLKASLNKQIWKTTSLFLAKTRRISALKK